MLDSKMLCLMTVASVVCTVHRSIVCNYIYTLVRSVPHAQGGLWYLVCVSFCSYSGSIIYRLWGGPLVIPTASAWKMKWWFFWNDCVQEIYMPRKQAKKSMYWHTVNWSGRSVYLGGKGTTKGCIDSHMLSTSVESPCQTLHELQYESQKSKRK